MARGGTKRAAHLGREPPAAQGTEVSPRLHARDHCPTPLSKVETCMFQVRSFKSGSMPVHNPLPPASRPADGLTKIPVMIRTHISSRCPHILLHLLLSINGKICETICLTEKAACANALAPPMPPCACCPPPHFVRPLVTQCVLA